jgi:hypothetical protein
MGISAADIPRLLLTIAVRRMPAERRDWGAAMLAELAQLRDPFARWRFALGCTRVALFPLRKRSLALIGGTMNVYVQKLRGVAGISLIWAPVWAAMFTILMFILQLFLPADGDVGTIRMMVIIAEVGFISGSLFGVLLSFAENGKAIHNLSLGRAALWGVLSSAVFPVLTGRANQTFWTCTFGAIVALALVALARTAESRGARQPRRNILLTCALMPVRDAVSPAKESAT